MKKKWLRIVFPIVVVVILILAGIWYTRPMTIAQLAPELDRETPALFHSFIRVWHDNGESEHLTLALRDGDPLYEEARDLLSQIRIKRTLEGALLDLMHGAAGSVSLEEGDVTWVLHLDGATFGLQYYGGELYYISFDTNNYCLCKVQNHNKTVEALNTFLLENGIFSDSES